MTVVDIAKMHADGQRIPMLTAYDYPTARLLDEAGIPMLLVGDSLGQACSATRSTVRVTMDEMIHHTKAVVRGAGRALVVGDMPFLSYSSPEEALENAGRFLREAGAHAVKIEGGVRSARIVEAMVKAGIPVMGHIGLTPQSINAIGKVRVQGKSREGARALLGDALAIQEAGAFSIVLELVPEQLAAAISDRLRIPTIGIGAGAGCGGQVQVVTDLLGLGDFIPRHAKPYADLRGTILAAARAYADDVAAGTFPGPEQSVRMDEAVLGEVLGQSSWIAHRRRHPVRRDPARPRPVSPSTERARPADPSPEDPAGAPVCAGRRCPTGRPRADHGLAACRPPGAHPAGARGVGDDGRDDLRQPEAVQCARRLRALPPERGARRRDLRRGRASTSSGHRPSRRSTSRASTRRSRSARSAEPLEGAARPGHFDGVATVVAILFALVGAERAYFGQKDAQQVKVVDRMARDLALPTEVVACPTVREPDGLALSSRNVHLTAEQRAAAPVIHRALEAACARWDGRRAVRPGAPRRHHRGPGHRAAGRGRVRQLRRCRDPRRARPGGGPRPAVGGGPVRHDPAHRQRAARLGAIRPGEPKPGERERRPQPDLGGRGGSAGARPSRSSPNSAAPTTGGSGQRPDRGGRSDRGDADRIRSWNGA